jgi:hypothetical protein
MPAQIQSLRPPALRDDPDDRRKTMDNHTTKALELGNIPSLCCRACMGIGTACPVELIWIFPRSDAGAAFGRFEKGRAGLSIGRLPFRFLTFVSVSSKSVSSKFLHLVVPTNHFSSDECLLRKFRRITCSASPLSTHPLC